MVGAGLHHVRVDLVTARRITGSVVDGRSEAVATWAWQDDTGLRLRWLVDRRPPERPQILELVTHVLQLTMARYAQDTAAEAPQGDTGFPLQYAPGLAPVTASPLPSARPPADPAVGSAWETGDTHRRPADLEDTDAA